jgi:hypothetical protein
MVTNIVFLYVVQTERTAKDIDFIVNNPLLSVRLTALEKLNVNKAIKIDTKISSHEIQVQIY